MNANQDFLDHIDEFRADQHEHLRFAILHQDEVTYGSEEECNIQYCIDNNIPCYNRKGPGGTIVHAAGSLALNYIYSHDRFPEFLSTEFIDDLCIYFKNKNLNAWIEGNDLLIDGFKVASGAAQNLPPDWRWCNIVILVSTTQNFDLIQKVCLKPMIKVPKALSDWGISTKEMIKFIINWFSEKNINIGEPN